MRFFPVGNPSAAINCREFVQTAATSINSCSILCQADFVVVTYFYSLGRVILVLPNNCMWSLNVG